MDPKVAANEYGAQISHAIRAQRTCNDMAVDEERLESKIRTYMSDLETMTAQTRKKKTQLEGAHKEHSTVKAVNRKLLEELQKKAPTISRPLHQVKQEHGICASATKRKIASVDDAEARPSQRRAGAEQNASHSSRTTRSHAKHRSCVSQHKVDSRFAVSNPNGQRLAFEQRECHTRYA